MTKWDDLSNEYGAFNAAQNQYEQTAQSLMQQFYEGLRTYLGTPEKPISYSIAKLVAVNTDSKELEIYSQIENYTQALSYNREDGSWRFGINIRLGHGFDWLDLYLDIRMVLREKDGEFQNARDTSRSFPFVLGQPGNLSPAYDYFTSLIHDTLQTKPWDSVEKIPIGFDLSGRERVGK